MTERGRTYNIIEELKKELKSLEEKHSDILIRMYEIKIEIGECEGYLKELDHIDGE